MFATATVASAEIGAAEKRALRGRAGFGDCFCRASIPATIRERETSVHDRRSGRCGMWLDIADTAKRLLVDG
jgi:hypothetical protein